MSYNKILKLLFCEQEEKQCYKNTCGVELKFIDSKLFILQNPLGKLAFEFAAAGFVCFIKKKKMHSWSLYFISTSRIVNFSVLIFKLEIEYIVLFL